MKNRISKRLLHLQNELKKRAMNEENEKKRADYWRLYYAALDIEHDIRVLVMEAEIRRLVEIMMEYGIPYTYVEPTEPPPADESPDSESEPPDHDDDIPPRQLGLWD
jgi:hypothetical protein